MAFEVGGSSNPGQGALEHVQDITDVEVGNFFDMSLESSGNEGMAFERKRRQRRHHGVVDDERRARRRLANAELDICLETLRAILPPSGKRDSHLDIMNLASMHARELHRSIDNQTDGLASEVNTTPGNPPVMMPPSEGIIPSGMQIPGMSSIADISHENPLVEVLREKEDLKLNIACMNRPGLPIRDLLAVLKLKGLGPVGGNIVCRNNILFANLVVEKYGLVAHPEALPESEEDEALKELLLRVIRQETQRTANSHINAN